MHANGVELTGVLYASVRNAAFLCIFARFCTFLCVSVRFFPTKMGCKKRKFAQNSAKMCKKNAFMQYPL